MNQGRRLLIESTMMGAVPVLIKEEIGLSLNSLDISQISILPDVSLVILMEPFYGAVTFRMVHWRKKELCAYQQRQSNALTQDIRMSKAATETALVIELGVAGNAQGLPDVDQKITGIAGSAVGINLPGRIGRNHINGIEAEHFLAPLQIVGHMINLTQSMGLGRS